MAPEEFIAKHASSADDAKSLWITGTLRDSAEKVLNHRPRNLRQRYWQAGRRTIWVLEEIGKEEPITAGFVVENGKIIDTQVLIFRESRGWEIRYPRFTAQFSMASMDKQQQLDRNIDGISGATLSVNAMRKMARLALTYHGHVIPDTTASVSTPASQPGDTGL